MNTTWQSPPIAAATSSPVMPRHPDVQKGDLRLMLANSASACVAVLGLGDDVELGPASRQLFLQPLAHQRFVFGDQCGRSALSSVRASLRRAELSGDAQPTGRRRRAAGRGARRNPRGLRWLVELQRGARRRRAARAARGYWQGRCRSRPARRPSPRRCRRPTARRGVVRRAAHASTSMRPPPGNGSMPCLIAFSVSVMSMPGGMAIVLELLRNAHRPREPPPRRVCMMPR